MIISVSRLKTFKACRRMYELKYIHNLEPVQTPEALETGLSYHQKIEELYKTGDVDVSDLSKESAMVKAYQKYIYPHFKMQDVECEFRYELGDDNVLIGRMDGMSDTGVLVEHKTTSMEITEKYEYDLQWDEQLLAYMLISGTRMVYYTVCRKPTIRLKKGETEEEFFNRMVEWYDTDTDSKIRVLEIMRSDEEVEAFKQELLATLEDMKSCKHFYKNTLHCFRFGRQCEYAGVCLFYDPAQEYIEFTRKEHET